MFTLSLQQSKNHKMLNLLSSLFIFFVTSESRLEPPKTPFVELQLQEYFTNYKNSQRKIFIMCNYLNVDEESAKDISNWFIKFNFCPSVISTVPSEVKRFPLIDASFIFLHTARNVEESITLLRKTLFWNPLAENHFIVSRKINHTDFVPGLLKSIWKRHILKFVMVVVSSKQLEIYSYNPFKNNEITNLEKEPNCYKNLFADKLSNLYGYKFKVALFEEIPLLYKNEDKWYGKDYKMLKLITSSLNATFEIVKSRPRHSDERGFVQARQSLLNDDADFCFNSIFIFSSKYVKTLDCTYPHSYNTIVVLVPVTSNDTKRKTHNLISIFNLHVWLCIVFLTFFNALILVITNRKRTSLPLFLLYSLGTLLGFSFQGFRNKRGYVKFQLITFILGAIIFRTAFNCFLISSFASPYTFDKITTLEELAKSEITICASTLFKRFIRKDIFKNIVFVETIECVEKIYNMETSYAYVMRQTAANVYINYLKKYQKEDAFYILKEPITVGYDIYVFQKFSPFTKKFDQYLLINHQTFLSNKFEESHKQKFFKESNESQNDNFVVLSMNHVYSVFCFLVGGLSVSFLTFVLELYIVKYIN